MLHPTLARLDDLAAHLARDPDAVALLGLGSAGVEHDRFDDHSDLDFFVVVATERAKRRMLDDVGWLAAFGDDPVWSFVNSPDGRKALYADGLFLEYAVFAAAELPGIRFAGARTVWSRPSAGQDLVDLDDHLGPPGPGPLDTVAFHRDEALSNLYVGLHRELRGERLSATRFVQVQAVDHCLALLRLAPDGAWRQQDPFEPTRRVERSLPIGAFPLAAAVAGYDRNADAAQAVLDWLRGHDPAPAAVAAVTDLLDRAREASPQG